MGTARDYIFKAIVSRQYSRVGTCGPPAGLHFESNLGQPPMGLHLEGNLGWYSCLFSDSVYFDNMCLSLHPMF